MSLTSKEAVESLSEVERAARRSATVYGYRKTSPHFFAWGLVWVCGYVGTYLSPENAGPIWLAVILIGVAASLVLGLKANREAGATWTAANWRMLGIIAIAQAFLTGVTLVMHPQGYMMGVLVPLMVGAVYAGAGLWFGLRLFITGTALMALTLFGFFFLPAYYCLWMAAFGGGALILAGFWFRTV